jgi:hypothetical protein
MVAAPAGCFIDERGGIYGLVAFEYKKDSDRYTAISGCAN